MNNVTVDLNKVKEIALKGIRRTTIFLGLGVNAARDEKFTKYQLPENHFLNMVPGNASEEQVAHFKQNFEKWVISNGIRELIETFALFLDKTHQSCLWFATNKSAMSSDKANRYGPDFEKNGVEGKLKKLHNTQARHCRAGGFKGKPFA